MKESEKNLARSALYAMLALQIRRELDPFAFARVSDLSALQLRDSIDRLRKDIGDEQSAPYVASILETQEIEGDRVRRDLLRSLLASAGERATYFAALGYPTEGAAVPDLGQPSSSFSRAEKRTSAQETEELAIATLLRYLPGYSSTYENAQRNLRIDAIFSPPMEAEHLPFLLIEYKHLLSKETLAGIASYLKAASRLFEGRNTRLIVIYSSISASRIKEEYERDFFFVQYDARNDQLAAQDLQKLLESVYPPPNTFA